MKFKKYEYDESGDIVEVKEQLKGSVEYYCRHCGTVEFIPKNMDVMVDPAKNCNLLCPKCQAQKKRRKMFKVKNDKSKNK